MNDLTFRDIPVLASGNVERGTILVMGKDGFVHQQPLLDRTLTPDEAQAKAVADRLLDRSSGALTFEMLQAALDRIHANYPSVQPDTIILSPQTRHAYVALLAANEHR